MLQFEFPDRIGMLQGQPDVIQSAYQAVLAKGIDLERNLALVRCAYHLPGQVHGQRITNGRISRLKQLLNKYYDEEQAARERAAAEAKAAFEAVVTKQKLLPINIARVPSNPMPSLQAPKL